MKWEGGSYNIFLAGTKKPVGIAALFYACSIKRDLKGCLYLEGKLLKVNEV